MTEELEKEIDALIKKNLKEKMSIVISTNTEWDYTNISVAVYYGEECISTTSDSIPRDRCNHKNDY